MKKKAFIILLSIAGFLFIHFLDIDIAEATTYCKKDTGDTCTTYGVTIPDCDECGFLANDNCGAVVQQP